MLFDLGQVGLGSALETKDFLEPQGHAKPQDPFFSWQPVPQESLELPLLSISNNVLVSFGMLYIPPVVWTATVTKL